MIKLVLEMWRSLGTAPGKLGLMRAIWDTFLKFYFIQTLFFSSVICLLSCSSYFISLSLSYIGSSPPSDLTSGFIVPTLSIVTGCPCQFPEVRELTFYHLSCRMRHLDLSWLGLGPMSASPWLLLSLVGVSWFLTRCLTQIYTLYAKCQRLRGFPQPPKRSWFWGHLGMVSM